MDPAAFRLKVSGLVNKSIALSLDEIKKMKSTDLVSGFECSGNRRPLQGLSSNGRWTGVPLKTVLDMAGVKTNAREIVFFGADKGEEEVDFRDGSPRWSSSSAAACRARRRCRPSSCWRTR